MTYKRPKTMKTYRYAVTIAGNEHKFETYRQAERFADEHGGARIEQIGLGTQATRQTAERAACLEAVRRRDGVRCWIADRWPEVSCWGDLDGHELFPRGRGGDPDDPANVRLACRRHHRAAHDNVALAEERGVLLPTTPDRHVR